MTKAQKNIIKVVAGGVIIYGLIYIWKKVQFTIQPPAVAPPPVLDATNTQTPTSKTKEGKKKTYTLSNTRALLLAKIIIDALNTPFSDDWAAIQNVFLELHTQGDVSKLALTFHNDYDRDLWTWLQSGRGLLPTDGLSTDHLNFLKDYVSKLPA